MTKLLLIPISILLFASCQSIYFQESQPTFVESQQTISSEFQGEFILESFLILPTTLILDSIKQDFKNRKELIIELKNRIKEKESRLVISDIYIIKENNSYKFDDSINVVKVHENLLFLNRLTENGYDLNIIKNNNGERTLISFYHTEDWIEENNFTFINDTTGKITLQNLTKQQIDLLMSTADKQRLYLESDLLNSDGNFSDEFYLYLKDLYKETLGGYQYAKFLFRE